MALSGVKLAYIRAAGTRKSYTTPCFRNQPTKHFFKEMETATVALKLDVAKVKNKSHSFTRNLDSDPIEGTRLATFRQIGSS